MAGREGHSEMWKGFIADCIKMPSSMSFGGKEQFSLEGKKKLCVVGTKASLEAVATSGLIPEPLIPAYNAMLARITPAPLNCASLTQNIFEGPLEELAIGCVTTEASRHTSPHRADQVRDFVRKNVPMNGTTALILAAPTPEATFAYATNAPKGHFLAKFKGAADGFHESLAQVPVTVITAGEAIADAQRDQANIIAESIQLAGRLVDTPANYLNTKTYAEIAEGLAKKHGFGCEVIRGEELQKLGLNALFGVGRAAEYGSALVVLTHDPAEVDNKDEVVCWAGKGIIFDTGGLNVKSRPGMCGMKDDMGGSAGVLGAFIAAHRLGVRKKLHALLALADNAINENAQRPDDIVRCLSGKTIELNNTDAEGRLVLCDAVAYAHKYLKPTCLVDMATLTGAQGVATGKHFASICANTDSIEEQALVAAKASGDQCFPVVFAPEYLLSEFSSEWADMKNSVANRSNAQVSCAGLFIYDVGFAGEYKGDWLHVDMAYPAIVDGKSTAFGVALLLKMLQV
eukprot:TRINITY_DN659_c0_g1_i4.p1 TRINITY_DN659_c0_g1~~TRINITY_DN659_c0_g1_i4.p1  ORF type:complete len:551 (+),score=193.90 TRINITY_DN659_c0_g1_i4:110-1654(+)